MVLFAVTGLRVRMCVRVGGPRREIDSTAQRKSQNAFGRLGGCFIYILPSIHFLHNFSNSGQCKCLYLLNLRGKGLAGKTNPFLCTRGK